MKIIPIVSACIIAICSAINPHPAIIATTYIDGLGYYRLTNYTVERGCLSFVDFVGNTIKSCSGYSLKTIEEYHRERIDSIPHNAF